MHCLSSTLAVLVSLRSEQTRPVSSSQRATVSWRRAQLGAASPNAAGYPGNTPLAEQVSPSLLLLRGASAEHVDSAVRTRRTALKGRVLLFASSQIGKPLGFPANPLTRCNWAALVCCQ